MGADGAGNGAPEVGHMGAALGRRHGVAIGKRAPLTRRRPGERPFDRARCLGPESFGEIDAARKRTFAKETGRAKRMKKIIFQPVGEAETVLSRRLVLVTEQSLVIAPAYVDGAEV